MKFGKISLKIDYSKAGITEKFDYVPHLDAYILDDQPLTKKRPAVVICPGGGYEFTSEREAEPIAMRFLAKGIQAFVLWYSVKPAIFPMALLELSKSVQIVREHADEWRVDKDRIAVMGFSAGGHLAASLSTLWNRGFLADTLGTTDDMIKPSGSILCYPVITSGEKGHQGSFENLLRGMSKEYWELTSLETQVTEATPPTFIWHTWTDDCVPVENTLYYVDALRKNNVSCECHIFKEGHHGLSLADEETNDAEDGTAVMPGVQPWIDMAAFWLKNI